MSLIILTAALLFGYSLLMLYFRVQWDVLDDVKQDTKYKPKRKVSVIIAARNEEKNIGKLLECLQAQNYPSELLEVIVVDDQSEDGTATIIKQFPIALYVSITESNDADQNAYKKKAIALGISKASGEIILTTDADCVMGPNWIKTMTQVLVQDKRKMLAGPVVYHDSSHWFQLFQGLDFMSMQGVTAAVLATQKGSMCNGANFMYEKKAYEEVNGFEGIQDKASGDDMMLMHKIRERYPEAMAYVKSPDAIVSTEAMENFRSFIQQRIRWASKNKSLHDPLVKWILAFVFFVNAALLFSIVQLLWQPQWAFHVLILFVIKGIVEYFFAMEIAQFFNRKKYLPYLFILQPLHIFYIVFVAILGLFSFYRWKGRRVH